MFGVATTLTVAVGLSALGSLLASKAVDHAPDLWSQVNEECAVVLGEDTPAIPRFITCDHHVELLAAAIELPSPTRAAREIIGINTGCPGTGLLTATYSGSEIQMTASSLPSQVFSLFVYGPPAANPIPFYDGTLCAHWGFLQRSHVSATSVAGVTQYLGLIQPNAGADVLSVQCIYRFPTGYYGGNLTNSLLVSFEPLP